MKHSKVLALIAVVSLTLSTAALAQSTKAPRAVKAQTSSIRGSVKSVSDSEIVLSQKGNDVTIALNSETKKIGDIELIKPTRPGVLREPLFRI